MGDDVLALLVVMPSVLRLEVVSGIEIGEEVNDMI